MEDIKSKSIDPSNGENANGSIKLKLNSKILIIEDEPILLSMYKTKFEKEGYTVYGAEDGFLGFDVAKKNKPDLILLDVVLNDTDGFTVLKKLKSDKETSSIPVIILSNLGSQQDLEYGLKLGACNYLIKSNTTPAQLVEKVRDGILCKI